MDTIIMSKGTDGWRWTRRNENGHIVGASTQGYSRKEDCTHNITATQAEPYQLIVNGGR